MTPSQANDIFNRVDELDLMIELARLDFWEYCKLKYPKHYTEDRVYLRQMCEKLQSFIYQDKKKFLVMTVPPRHRKSFTGTNFIEYIFGEDPTRKVISGSYNETLSNTFATKVRNTIMEEGRSYIDDEGTPHVVYRDIFPDTKIQYGEASKGFWALEGSGEKNYLATSPTGTATGIGGNIIFIDDIIKNKLEAYNTLVKEGHWDWMTNTMMQRTEGDDYKVIVIMTRWATDDLAGRIIQEYGDLVEVIAYSAIQDNGEMLDSTTLSRRAFDIKTKKMSPDIVEANYNQRPVDIKGRLYRPFATYNSLPDVPVVKNYTDTADKGTDYLCSLNWILHEKKVYITGIYFSDEAMEVTEPEVARLLHKGKVNEATIESNNGGRGFGRNVRRIMDEVYSDIRTVFIDKNQSSNKEARILSSSAWVQENVLMPEGWDTDYPDFYKQLMSYQRKGKNAHDDVPDVLAGIYEAVTDEVKMEFDFA